jgi:hypothetical protein
VAVTVTPENQEKQALNMPFDGLKIFLKFE